MKESDCSLLPLLLLMPLILVGVKFESKPRLKKYNPARSLGFQPLEPS